MSDSDDRGASGIRHKLDSAFAELHGGSYSAYTRLADQGVTLMGWADPFYPDAVTPAHVIAATRTALEAGKTHYTMPIGTAELRAAIARKLAHYNGIEANPETEIIVTPGSDLGLYFAMRPFLRPGQGDEVLNPDPSYSNNFRNVALLGATSISVPLHEQNGFQIEVAELEKRLTDKTRMLVLTHPNNPTTTVYSRATLEAISRFVIDNDLVVVTDQAFESTVFDGREFVSLATLPGMWERTLSVFSISKDTGLSGFRVGYIVACAGVMDALHGAAVYILGATNTLAQVGALAAFENDDFIAGFNRSYLKRRDFAHRVFNDTTGVSCLLPESGFLLWLNVSRLGSAEAIADYLVDDARVAVTPGTRYGRHGEGYLRIVLGSLREDAAFEDAILRMAASLERLATKRST